MFIITSLICFSWGSLILADDLPDIVPSAPVVVPAQEEATYSKLWLSRMVVSAPSPTSLASITFSFVPYDGAGKIISSPRTSARIPDVFGLAEKDPQFAQVFAGVLSMVNKYKDVDFSKPFTVDPVTFAVTQE